MKNMSSQTIGIVRTLAARCVEVDYELGSEQKRVCNSMTNVQKRRNENVGLYKSH